MSYRSVLNDQPQQSSQRSSENASGESSTHVSQPASRSQSKTRDGRRERNRVRFTPGGESMDAENHRTTFDIRDRDENDGSLTRTPTRLSPAHSRNHSIGHPVRHHDHVPHPADIHQRLSEAMSEASPPHVLKPRPSSIRYNSNEFADSTIHSTTTEQTKKTEDSDEDEDEDDDFLEISYAKDKASLNAQSRAIRLSRAVGTHSAPASAKTSPTLDAIDASMLPTRTRGPGGLPVRIDDIPLAPLDKHGRHTHYEDYSTDSDEEGYSPRSSRRRGQTSEAHRLVRVHTRNLPSGASMDGEAGLRSGAVTPEGERDEDWVAAPNNYRGGVLSHLLKLYQNPNTDGHSRLHNLRQSSFSSLASLPTALTRPSTTASDAAAGQNQFGATPGTESSGTSTPKKWYQNQRPSSTGSLAALVGTSAAAMGSFGGSGVASPPKRPSNMRTKPGRGGIGGAFKTMGRPGGRNNEDEIKITIHIAEVMSRHRYIIKLCRALMSYGAPTHRLEEYLKMTARVLEIESQFLYLPGCMIISFDDSSTHTAEVKLVRLSQGVNLGKLKDVHQIYKEVVHDIIGVEEATQRLESVIARPEMNPWIKVLFFGFASATVGPFAFGARFIDLPICFILGALVGALQHLLAARSDLYANVFEVTAAVLTSFLARALGSIRGGNIFCFSALAQSSIALILPGYTVLSASLELQSRAIVPGSVRMVYAIIYSLFLGFGITIGTVFYALFDKHATSDTTCRTSLPSPYLQWIFVPLFTACLMVLNNAHRAQAPVMLIISFAGYLVNYFSAQKLPSNAQISQTLGALTVGVLGNLYSRLRHGVAAAALLPAIFVQVPSGLAATGSLVSGIQSADLLLSGSNNGSGNASSISTGSSNGGAGLDTIVYNVGVGMVQVAIGITVGLFLSALLVYPFGKRRSGLFSF